MYSSEHVEYLKKIKRNNIVVKFFQIFIVLTLLIVWELLARFEIINTFISSSPSKVIETIISLHNQGNLYNHILITIYETFLSFFMVLL